MVLGEEDQLLPGSLRFYNSLFEEELPETRLVPRFKGGVPQVLERSLSAVVLFVRPSGVRPPVLGYEIPKVFFGAVVGFRNIDLVFLEPALQLFCIPLGVFWKGVGHGLCKRVWVEN